MDEDIKNEEANHNLAIIKQSSIFTEGGFKRLVELKDELIETLNTVQVFRTPTEMEISVLDRLKHPTPDARYWQSQREQNVMFQELVMLCYEYQKNLKEIEVLDAEILELEDLLSNGPSDYIIKKLNATIDLNILEIDKKRFISVNQRRIASARLMEIQEWHKIKEQLKKDMEYGTEDPDKHQLASYTMRFINQYLSLIKYKPQHVGTAELNNLLGQLKTAIGACEQKGILKQVLSQYSFEDAKKVTGGYLLK